MNKDIVLNLVAPFLKDESITYNEFDKIFDVLSLREQYSVVDILAESGICLVDDEFSFQEDEEELFEEIENLELDFSNDSDYQMESDSSSNNDREFKNLFENVFKDSGHDYENDETVVHTDIRQSNEVLCMLIQQGNKQALQDLCVKNTGLIQKYANGYKKYYRFKLDLEDLEQAGFLGLMKAAYRFETKHDTKFSTYAVWWIKQSIAREIMDTGNTIRIPVHMMERIMKVNRLLGVYDDLDPEEQIGVVAKEAGLGKEDVRYCILLSKTYLQPTSLNIPIGEDGQTELGELIPDDTDESVSDVIEYEDLRRNLKEVLDTLSDREKNVLILRFGLDDGRPRTLEEIGGKMGVTRERIRQIEEKALKKLRHPSRSKKLRDFLK